MFCACSDQTRLRRSAPDCSTTEVLVRIADSKENGAGG